MDDVVMTENGESLEIKGIDNACVAKCAWLLDGHIRALREHYESELDKLRAYKSSSNILDDSRLGVALECLNSLVSLDGSSRFMQEYIRRAVTNCKLRIASINEAMFKEKPSNAQ